MKKTWVMLVVMVVAVAWGQSDAPVVQIPGRSTYERQARAPVPMPSAVQLESAMPDDAATATARTPLAESAPSVVVPVGTIMAWAKSMTNAPALPRGWVECNGQPIEDPQSPFVGQSVPDLNGATEEGGRFLRGAAASGAKGGSTTHTHPGYRSQKYGTQRSPVAAPIPTEHLPPFYAVVWIMRVK